MITRNKYNSKCNKTNNNNKICSNYFLCVLLLLPIRFTVISASLIKAYNKLMTLFGNQKIDHKLVRDQFFFWMNFVIRFFFFFTFLPCQFDDYYFSFHFCIDRVVRLLWEGWSEFVNSVLKFVCDFNWKDFFLREIRCFNHFCPKCGFNHRPMATFLLVKNVEKLKFFEGFSVLKFRLTTKKKMCLEVVRFSEK